LKNFAKATRWDDKIQAAFADGFRQIAVGLWPDLGIMTVFETRPVG
jgi:hypothetical protein